jgi:hypothetical protein
VWPKGPLEGEATVNAKIDDDNGKDNNDGKGDDWNDDKGEDNNDD